MPSSLVRWGDCRVSHAGARRNWLPHLTFATHKDLRWIEDSVLRYRRPISGQENRGTRWVACQENSARRGQIFVEVVVLVQFRNSAATKRRPPRQFSNLGSKLDKEPGGRSGGCRSAASNANAPNGLSDRYYDLPVCLIRVHQTMGLLQLGK